MKRQVPTRTLQELCLECGLCCNGGLFADVRLGPEDHGLQIGALKRSLFAPHQPTCQAVRRLNQPCGFHQDDRCQIYHQRPSHCRRFDCGVIRGVRTGLLTEAQARHRVGKARRLLAKAEALLERLGNRSLNRPAAARFRRTAREMEAGPPSGPRPALFGELSQVMHEFHWWVSRHIHPGPEP